MNLQLKGKTALVTGSMAGIGLAIAARHASVKKNTADGVRSTPYVPLRDVIAFIAVMNETVTPYLAAKGHSALEVDKMHQAWCKSMQLQLALWAGPHSDTRRAPSDWWSVPVRPTRAMSLLETAARE